MCCAVKPSHCEAQRAEAIYVIARASSLLVPCHCERSEAILSPAPQDRPRLHAVTTSAAADLRHMAVSFEKLHC